MPVNDLLTHLGLVSGLATVVLTLPLANDEMVEQNRLLRHNSPVCS